ncbi:MAG: hypothetical protein HUK09_01305 [Bacteroidaceae bacterium]|nr:hypothetical protein [Bacteroidaceae bacterium]
MSDGNFNRSLLPNKDYSSGLRAGEARMKVKALNAFAQQLNQPPFDSLSEQERNAMAANFALLLNN